MTRINGNSGHYIPQFLHHHWKAAACVALAIPLLTYLYQRMTRPTPNFAIRNPAPISINPLSLFWHRSLAGVNPDLGFKKEALVRVAYLGSIGWSFEVVRNTIVSIIRYEKNSIVLSRANYEDILKYVDFGIGPPDSYAKASEKEKRQSWVHQILQALVEDNYISSFKIATDGKEVHIHS
jgi:hypothetical protein